MYLAVSEKDNSSQDHRYDVMSEMATKRSLGTIK